MIKVMLIIVWFAARGEREIRQRDNCFVRYNSAALTPDIGSPWIDYPIMQHRNHRVRRAHTKAETRVVSSLWW